VGKVIVRKNPFYQVEEAQIEKKEDYFIGPLISL